MAKLAQEDTFSALPDDFAKQVRSCYQRHLDELEELLCNWIHQGWSRQAPAITDSQATQMILEAVALAAEDHERCNSVLHDEILPADTSYTTVRPELIVIEGSKNDANDFSRGQDLEVLSGKELLQGEPEATAEQQRQPVEHQRTNASSGQSVATHKRRSSLCRAQPSYLEERNLGPESTKLLQIISSLRFEQLTTGIVIFNAALMGIQVQLAATQRLGDHAVFQVLNATLFVWYISELLIRILALRSWFFYVRDWPWNLFDSLCVFCTCVDFAMDYLIVLPVQRGPLLLVRSIRVVRIARVLRVLRFLREMQLMIWTILGTLKALFWAALLCLMVIYTFAIVLTLAVADLAEAQNFEPFPNEDRLKSFFGSVPVAILTLFQSFTGGLSWAEPCTLLFQELPLYGLCYCMFIFFMIFAMLNVITGFFCDRTIDASMKDKAAILEERKQQKRKWVERFRHVFSMMDEDHSGYISLSELEGFSNQEALRSYLASLDMDFYACLDVWEILDANEDGKLNIEEFVEGLLSLRGNAKTIDLIAIKYDLRREMKEVQKIATTVQQLIINSLSIATP
eukprot:TRINITY_DN27580_c0_g1_i1.p1 TRINITY_DN27580_c0_g1~~TRINITY_DN27580_c0_g1_i1.p1  ORF type:complete len:570 (+),score=100.10 TRINITY_DN27580_c0_g1_i1:56-1765(+)